MFHSLNFDIRPTSIVAISKPHPTASSILKPKRKSVTLNLFSILQSILISSRTRSEIIYDLPQFSKMSFILRKFTKQPTNRTKTETLPWSCVVERFEQTKRDRWLLLLLLFHCPFKPKCCHANQRLYMNPKRKRLLLSV